MWIIMNLTFLLMPAANFGQIEMSFSLKTLAELNL